MGRIGLSERNMPRLHGVFNYLQKEFTDLLWNSIKPPRRIADTAIAISSAPSNTAIQDKAWSERYLVPASVIVLTKYQPSITKISVTR